MSKRPTRRQTLLLTITVLLLITLPALMLLPAGLIWLWQTNLIYPWLATLILLTLTGYLIALWMQRRLTPDKPPASSDQSEALQSPVTPPSDNWSPQELAAWQEVLKLAQSSDKNILGSWTLLQQSARQVIEQVARHYHPDHKDPVWNFTLPEALLLSERVSQQLRLVLLDQVPAAHMIQVGQILRLWEYREGSMKLYRGATMAYRLVRLINPLSALLAEARDRILGIAFDETSDYLQQRGVRIWIEEIGRAAIDLYSGRLQVDSVQLSNLAASDSMTQPPAGPVQVLIAGQVNTGKSSLANALLKDTQAAVDLLPMTADSRRYRLSQDDETLAVLIDSPGIDNDAALKRLAAQCADVDCILWVIAANRADREMDFRALEMIRDWFRDNPRRSMPPLLLVVSHIDRLSPAREWSPPYDLIARTQPKAIAIYEALQQIAQDLKVPDTDLLPVRLDQGPDGYNINLLWALLQERLELAKKGRSQRLQLLARKSDWRKLLQQARGTGRLIKNVLKR
ncbi:GTPase family protein [Nitrincola sp. MINF-07-Sa-05]|uniref:GTPase family protein n=1 Tax=Nitrincola salilacus TaxID=3400273 RepID=UPI003917B81E